MSLRGRLLLFLSFVWLAFGGAVTLWVFEHASAELDAALDSRLAASAAMVARLVTQLPLEHAADSRGAAALADLSARDGVACEVSRRHGGALARMEAGIAGGGLALDAAPIGFGSLTQSDAVWRTYVIETDGLRIVTAGRTDIRAILHRQMAWTALLPGVAGLLVGFVLLWFGVGRGLAVVEGLRRRLARDEPWTARDLPSDSVPKEFMPFIQTLARLTRRMHETLLRERHFSDHAAHEIRSPVTAIKAHLQVLQRLPQSGQDSASRQAIEHALQGTARLDRLIEQLLMLARAEGGDTHGRPVCEVVRVLTRMAERKPARVRWRMPAGRPYAALPDALLDCAVRNLVDNALKYSPEDSVVEVDAAITAGRLVVMVRDYGPGLTPAQCAQAAAPFWRGARQGEGAGLGLSIVAAIAARHGGALALEPAQGKGLCCRLSLPLAESAELNPRTANSCDRETVRAGPTPV